MIGFIVQRFFHSGRAFLAASSALAKLRKSTGYSVSNCKKAIEMFPDNIKEAEEWLHAEAKRKGWSKWAKIQSRTAAQGLIGVCTQGNVGVLVEVNCETDFVARNAEFQEFVEKMISGCMKYAETLNVDSNIAKSVLEQTHLSTVKCETSSLGELLVAAACKFNEKTIAKRAVCLKVDKDILLSSLSHPSTECPNLKGASLGKYGVLLALKKNEKAISEDLNSLGSNMCQHIIGMNPLSVGELTEKDIQKFINKTEPKEDIEANIIESEQAIKEDKTDASDDSHTEGEEEVDKTLKDCEETRLLFQPYLLDPDVTTGELLFKSGLEVVDFERFECGESDVKTEQSLNVAQSVGA